MVNKHVLRETFMKLESYDRINVISDILRLSNSLELEFYSSVIESILQYHKLSVNSLKEDLNQDSNLKCFFNSDCTDSNVRSKLISTISLLKASNINGATQIFEFLRQNHIKLKEQAHSNPSAYEEVLLIYQLANDHPAFSFDHCQEIYDYLTQIRLISVSRDYFNADNNDEYVNDLRVETIEKNDKQQYMYRIKVQWEHYECCIIRSLEEVYRFYQKLSEMFPLEVKTGEICHFYLSFIQDSLDLSLALMSTFFRDFMKSPQLILHCDYVRQFFKPRVTDKHICDCASCDVNFNELHWTGDRKFDPVTKCNNGHIPSDNDDNDMQSCDNTKPDTPCSSSCNYSMDSKCCRDNTTTANTTTTTTTNNSSNNRQLEVTINNRMCSEDDSESSVKCRRKKTKTYHSSGSSPINTPSDDSETCSKSESLMTKNTGYSRHSRVVIEAASMTPSSKDMRTEKWLCQTSKTIINDINTKSLADPVEHYDDDTDTDSSSFDTSSIDQCQIGNLHDWLKHTRLHKYHPNLYPMTFGQFHSLTEDSLNDLGFVEGASKKLVSLIRSIKRSEIVEIDENIVNISLRERCHSSDSGTSVLSSSADYLSSLQQPLMPGPLPLSSIDGHYLDPINRTLNTAIIQPYNNFNYFMSSNYMMFPPNFIPNLLMIPTEKSDQIYQMNKQCGPQ